MHRTDVPDVPRPAPELEEGNIEAKVIRWLKHEGDHVEMDELLVEVETAKAITELPSPATGILREITVRENYAVRAGPRLAVIEPDFGHGY